MANFMQTASFQPASDYNVEAADIARRRQYAQMLQTQSQEPLQGQMAGGWYVAPSWTQGANKALSGALGAYFDKKATEDEKKLGEKADDERKQLFANLGAIGQGVPNLASDPTKLANLNTGTQTDVVPGIAAPQVQPTSPQQRNLLVAQMLAQSKLPDMRDMGNKLLIEALTKENNPANALFQKVDPKDFTADSVKQFMASGDYSVLKPRVKMEAANLGGVTRLYNPYETTGDLTHTATPDTVAKLDNTNFWNRNLTANQQLQGRIDLGRLGNQNIETNFNTGSSAGLPQLPSNFQVPPAGQPPVMPQAGGTPPAAPAPSVSRPAPAQGGPLLPPSMQGKVTPKMQAELAAEQPRAQQALTAINQQFDNALTQIDDLLKNQSGVSGITGTIAGRTPSILPSSVNAQASLDTLKNQLGVQQLQAMREASKTGGAVGNVTEKEWPILQNQLDALQQSQSTSQFMNNLKRVKETMLRMKQNAATTYTQTYGSPGGAQGASGSWDGGERRQSPRSSSNRVVVDY